MFVVKILMKKVGEYAKFEEAFKVFWTAIMAQLRTGTSYQNLLEANLIEHPVNVTGDEKRVCVMAFLGIKELAYEVGLLVDSGELADPAPEVNPMVVDTAFLQTGVFYLQGQASRVNSLMTTAVEHANAVEKIVQETK